MKLRHLLFGMLSMTAISPATFGFDLALFILGMTGGVVRTVIHDKINLRTALINMFVGGIVANYFTKIVSTWFRFTDKEHVFAVAILVGFFAVGFFVLLEKGEEWAKQNPRTFFSWIINGLSTMVKGDGNSMNNSSTNNKKSNENANNDGVAND